MSNKKYVASFSRVRNRCEAYVLTESGITGNVAKERVWGELSTVCKGWAKDIEFATLSDFKKRLSELTDDKPAGSGVLRVKSVKREVSRVVAVVDVVPDKEENMLFKDDDFVDEPDKTQYVLRFSVMETTTDCRRIPD